MFLRITFALHCCDDQHYGKVHTNGKVKQILLKIVSYVPNQVSKYRWNANRYDKSFKIS